MNNPCIQCEERSVNARSNRIALIPTTLRMLISLVCSVLNTTEQPEVPSHLEHIGNDKEGGKDPPLLPHSKQPNDPGEAKQRGKDDGGLQQLPE